jgi:alpha-D-xyloside xylohydrolase
MFLENPQVNDARSSWRARCSNSSFIAILLVMALTLQGCGRRDSGNFEKTADGVIVTPTEGPAKRVRLQVMSDRIVRVTAVPVESLQLPESLMVAAKPASGVQFNVESADGKSLSYSGQPLTFKIQSTP